MKMGPPGPEAGPGARVSRRLRQRKRRDRFARWIVSAGGLAIIASVLGISLFLIWQVLPLLRGVRVESRQVRAAPAATPLAVLTDEARTHTALLGADGVLRIVRESDGAVVEQPLCAGATVVQGGTMFGEPGFVLGTADGRAFYVTIAFETEYGASGATVHPRVGEVAAFDVDPARAPLLAVAASGRELSTALAAARADGVVVLAQRSVSENLFTGEKSATVTERELRAPSPVERLTLDARRENLFGATRDGQLLWWNLNDTAAAEPQSLSIGAPVTALTLLIGDEALVVGQADGSLSIWFRVASEGSAPRLTRIRELPAHAEAIRLLAPSWRDRTFLAQDAGGTLGLYYSTSARTLWRGATPLRDATAAAICPKSNGVVLAASDRIVALDVEIRHPEASLTAFFGKVWYEGYDRPEYVWQSSSGSDEAEPKLSLTPLLFGTLKATLFSLLFAVPLALLAAMYTAQFMHWSLRRYVKPTVEVMASLPSVVLGFLAGLWLAPRVTQFFLGVPIFLLLFVPAILLAGWLGARLPHRLRHRFPEGFAAIAFVAVAAATVALSVVLCRPLEVACFDGDFIGWLRGTLGITYDSKNCVVLGLAMGIAVIPIIFSIAEDAFSNVPNSLVSGSLALGADRWHTVTRVVLPTASPGLFSAVMIGFGRAVGETMIVVMASGNTPVMDWSIFNGLRSLSANIATEIPEAAQGGTLYRTLFLAALLLFAVTFAANTAAELVRQHLRQRYARL